MRCLLGRCKPSNRGGVEGGGISLSKEDFLGLAVVYYFAFVHIWSALLELGTPTRLGFSLGIIMVLIGHVISNS